MDDDSDGDGFVDWIEGFDDDTDGDALNDLVARATAYESANTNPGHYVNTDDADADGIPNWLEDTDGDGSPNFLDPDNALYRDSDNDGIVDIYDVDNNGAISLIPNADGDSEPDFRDLDNTVSLPVELIEFTANRVDQIVQLDWTTLTEINNDYFEIEKLLEENFKPIVKIAGAGNSNKEQNYRAYDRYPADGYNYYRLRQVDFDGKATYSTIKSVLFKSTNSSFSKLYPNPNDGQFLYIELNTKEGNTIHWSILDEKGVLILNNKTQSTDQEVTRIELLRGAVLSSGVYFLRLINGQEIHIEKVIIQ